MRRPVALAGILAVFILSATLMPGQEKKDPPKAKGQLPANFGKLGLSDEQKTRIYTIQAEYKAKLDALNKQVAEMKAKQKKEVESVLTDAQKEQLRKLLVGDGDKKPTDKKPAETKKPDEKKPTDK